MAFSVVVDFEEFIGLMEILKKFKDEIESKENEINKWKDAADIYKMWYYRQIDCTTLVRRDKEYWFKEYKKILKKYKNVMNNGSKQC